MSAMQRTSDLLPTYICTKEVRAGKITQITDKYISIQTGPGGPEVETYFTPEFFDRHIPEVGGYIVFYADGYISYSPAEPFESGYVIK